MTRLKSDKVCRAAKGSRAQQALLSGGSVLANPSNQRIRTKVFFKVDTAADMERGTDRLRAQLD